LTVNAAAKTHGATFDELLALNRDIQRSYAKSGGMLPRGYVLKIPMAPPVQLADTTTRTGH
jgi:hypothetical protein